MNICIFLWLLERFCEAVYMNTQFETSIKDGLTVGAVLTFWMFQNGGEGHFDKYKLYRVFLCGSKQNKEKIFIFGCFNHLLFVYGSTLNRIIDRIRQLSAQWLCYKSCSVKLSAVIAVYHITYHIACGFKFKISQSKAKSHFIP